MVKVTTINSHFGNLGMKVKGDVYETHETTAAELKLAGLVEYDGPAAKEKPVEKVLVSDKKEKVEAAPLSKKVITKPTTKK